MPPSGPPEHDCADAAALIAMQVTTAEKRSGFMNGPTSLGLRGCGVTSRNVVDRLSR